MVGVAYGGKGRHHSGVLLTSCLDNHLALVNEFAGSGTFVHQHLKFKVLGVKIIGVCLHKAVKVLAALLLAFGAVEPVACKAQGAAVGWMHLRAAAHQRIQLCSPGAEEVVVDVLEYLVDIVAFGCRIEAGVGRHIVQRGEERRDVSLHAVHLALAQDCRHIFR